MRALMDVLDEELGKEGVHARRQEGSIDSGWVLLDYGSVVAHIFTPEERGYYNLEALWGRGVPVVRFQ
jgi:ribosome-associated protein